MERLEQHAADWHLHHHGSVVELHAYALPEGIDEAALRRELRAQLDRVYPELAGVESSTSSGWSGPTACSCRPSRGVVARR